MAKTISLSKEDIASMEEELKEKGDQLSPDEKQFLSLLVKKAKKDIELDPQPGWNWSIPGT